MHSNPLRRSRFTNAPPQRHATAAPDTHVGGAVGQSSHQNCSSGTTASLKTHPGREHDPGDGCSIVRGSTVLQESDMFVMSGGGGGGSGVGGGHDVGAGAGVGGVGGVGVGVGAGVGICDGGDGDGVGVGVGGGVGGGGGGGGGSGSGSGGGGGGRCGGSDGGNAVPQESDASGIGGSGTAVEYRLHEFGLTDPSLDLSHWPGFSLNPGLWDLARLGDIYRLKFDRPFRFDPADIR